MKELSIEETAKAYGEAYKRVAIRFGSNVADEIFPEFKESEDERIRRELIRDIDIAMPIETAQRYIAWIKKQGNIDLKFFENGENEKREFVGYGFLKCKGDFLSFKEGETYWLEYMGKDNYNVRSDNLLGQTFHITPQQLYTVFRPTTWIEKQGEQKPNDNVASTTQSYTTPNQKFFQWIYDRLIHVHNENPNVDYMLSLKERIKNMPKPAWGEVDDTKLKTACTFIKNTSLKNNDGIVKETLRWLKSLKGRVQPQPQQEWIEEDGRMIEVIIKHLERQKNYQINTTNIEQCQNWLKSLKDRYAFS